MAIVEEEVSISKGLTKLELIFKKKMLLVSLIIILFIFAFGFIGANFIFTTPNKVYRTPIAKQYQEFCKDKLNALDPHCATQRLTYQAPSLEHPLGTDDQGRDELSRLSWGVYNSLLIGITSGTIITALAIIFGAIAAYYGGIFDDIAQFIVNLFLVLPVVPMLIFIAYFTRTTGIRFNFPLLTIPKIDLIFFTIPKVTFIDFQLDGLFLIACIIGFTSWGWAARSIRSQVLSLKERNFINMAKISGLNNLTISIQEVLPNMFSYISLIFAISLGLSIASEAGISVLGIGVDTNVPTLGTLLYWVVQLISVTTYEQMIYILLFPGLIITILFVFLYVLQAEMDDIFNPRLKKG